MTKTIEDLFVYLRLSSDCLIAFLILLFFRKAKLKISFWIILGYCLFDLLFNVLTEKGNFQRSVLEILYSSFTLIEYSLFTWILWANIQNSTFKKIIIAVSFLFVVLMVVDTYYFESRSVDSVSIGIETILILVYSFYYFFEEMNNVDNLFIYSKPEFWIVTGMIIYLAGSFFIYVFANQVDEQTLAQYWFLTNAFYVLQILLFGMGLIIYVKKNLKKPTTHKPHPYLN